MLVGDRYGNKRGENLECGSCKGAGIEFNPLYELDSPPPKFFMVLGISKIIFQVVLDI